ncbi:hypothetical protein BDN72DRAFT_962488 [Pluteus cervinus]|uniref:Uncharacterized protein n=1 Tax=Pluteus cervinus TaxID=181527 RepID=A0ACD3AJC8_9AGAR|nr:hypothetical protein BDN72DRAFT_962488 [Pluteus cervinus]
MPFSPHPILAQHFDSGDVAFAKIDQEIAILEENIRTLRAFRNTFTATYSIPPEVLTRIFSFARRLPGYDWIALTHVSQYWRSVALGSPSLWSYISSHYPEHVVNEWLQRSKSAPLTVNLNNIQNAAFIGESLFRIRELILQLRASCWDELVNTLSSQAPLLEYLSVSTSNNRPPSNVSNTMFGGMAPPLRRLELTNCSIDTNSSLFPNFTVLQLCNPPQKFKATELLRVLQRTPRLTSLTLSEVLRTDDPSVSSRSGIITLSFLESISIRGRSFIQDLGIVSQLSFPTTSSVRFNSMTKTGLDVTPAFADFVNVLNAARQQSLPSLQTSVPSSRLSLHCSWHKFTLEITIDSPQTSSATDFLKLELEAAGVWSRRLEIPDTSEIAFLLPTLPISTLTSFSTDCDIGIETWANVFGSLSHLSRISAAGPLAINILFAIAGDFNSIRKIADRKRAQNQAKKNTRGTKKKGKGKGIRGGDGNETNMDSTGESDSDWDFIFPVLGALDLHRTTFPESAEYLIDALQARKTIDKGVDLGVYGCQISEGMIDALDGVVPQLVRDRQMGPKAEKRGEPFRLKKPYGL